ncbi:hypothetical protein L873DRAFT_1816822 [Choiromyces venosus 120613-1]|uniref:Cerato-platanin n=1 Tax=Choiromyces venosus 120613-1 TaxID=1336337 RepID=A0A3N4J3L4_9PEZI|nr:hypothetical protein L873DRAFT_1816822 [Choiromyces venosus 120613-1]
MYYPKTLLLALMTLVASTVLSEVHSTAAYDNVYDLPDLPTLDLARSNGVAGLSSTLGFDRISQVPHYPLVGAIEKVEGWGSLSCRKCFRVTNQQSGQCINIIAVDHADTVGKENGLRCFS